MTLPWARHLWREHQRDNARAELAALNAAALGSAAKYGGGSGRSYRKRAQDLIQIIEKQD
jgi:hypothetical protein